jgi:hypothetical protein
VKRGGNLQRTGFQRKHPCGAVLPLLLPGETDDPKRICTCGSSAREWGTSRPPMRRTEIRPMSKRRAKENRERSKVLAELAGENPWCGAGLPGCTGQAQDGHEILTRARGGSITDKANILPICRSCHRAVTTPKDSESIHASGLLRHSWEKGDVA